MLSKVKCDVDLTGESLRVQKNQGARNVALSPPSNVSEKLKCAKYEIGFKLICQSLVFIG